MEGRARAAKREFEARLSQAWHTEAFAREKRLKPLKQYLGYAEKKDDGRGVAHLIGALMALKEQGIPMKVRRVKLRP